MKLNSCIIYGGIKIYMSMYTQIRIKIYILILYSIYSLKNFLIWAKKEEKRLNLHMYIVVNHRAM